MSTLTGGDLVRPDMVATDVRWVSSRPAGRQPVWRVMRRNWMLYAMLLPGFVLLVLFRFLPLWGISIAFLDYYPLSGITGSPFVGLENFRRVMTMRESGEIFRNTIFIATGKIIVGQVAAVVFAMLIFELAYARFKRVMQTIAAVPHFMSWVIIGGVMVQMLAGSGVINMVLKGAGLPLVRFLGSPVIFPWTLIFTETWKEFGFGSVIYLAALTSINPELYEAAAVDGAGRLRRMLSITLPGIMPTIILMACLNLGHVLDAGFEQVLTLLNPLVYSTGDIIDTFVYRVGLLGADFSLGTAVGLLKAVVGFVLIVLSYWLADRLANYRIF